jgi:hypothetical protein
VYAQAISPPPPPPDGEEWDYTDADGEYTISGLITGDYIVSAEAVGYVDEYYDGARNPDNASPVAVTEGQNTPDIDFSLDLAGTITGTVEDAGGNPIQGAWVIAEPSTQIFAAAYSPPVIPPGGGSCWTGSNGRCTIEGLGASDYIVSAGGVTFPPPCYVTEYYDGVTEEDDATAVTVNEGQDTAISFSLQTSALGDANCNGQVSMVDAMLIAQSVVGLIESSEICETAADVNCNGAVTMVDAMLVAQYVVGLIDEFPCNVSLSLTPVPSPPTPTP